ncbi:MAG: chemotaxis protein [Sulfurospirillum sp.]|nr:chemotaxis protein [Sulfurospirillum sp.]MBL0702990.1 chemotaxis protein [Sulfurospirillum sp.]
MTQEELDTLMMDVLNEEMTSKEKVIEKDISDMENTTNDEDKELQEMYKNKKTPTWPLPTDEQKMVCQLDYAIKDSEIKAGEVFDKLEEINEFIEISKKSTSQLDDVINSNIKLFSKLCEKFPNVKDFSQALDDNKNIKNEAENLIQITKDIEDEVMTIMDTMQHQDIHRQKIGRAVNTMRALSSYINTIFEGKIDDPKHTSSAIHADGNLNTNDIISSDDIDELVSNLRKS